MSTAPGWYPDPSGRYEHRYHNGSSWTADVAVEGRRFVDPGGPWRPSAGPPRAGEPPAGAQPASTPGGRNRSAVAALVLGISAATLGWVPFLCFLTAVAAVLAVVFGVAGRRRARATGTARSFATWGLALGAVGLPVSALGIGLTAVVLRALDRYEEPAAHEIALTACTLDGATVRATGQLTNRSDGTATFTVRVALARRAGGRGAEIERVELSGVAPGATVDWSATGRPDGVTDGAPTCTIDAVRGPLPYGIDPGF